MNEQTDERQASAGQVERPVRPLLERLRAGHTDWDGSQMADETQPMDCLTAGDVREAADEIERLSAALRKANDQAEHFERLWYLAKEDADRYAFAKTLEGQVVTMETFKVRGAAELDQALDDAMVEDADARNEAGYAA